MTLVVVSLNLLLPYLLDSYLMESKSFSQKFYDRQSELLRITLSGDEKYRFKTDFNEIDPQLTKAFLNKEDKYFYWHLGFNPISLARAFYKTYIFKGLKQGGSTITMQVVRLLYPESTRSIYGKLIQLFQAAKLELFYSKNEILLSYLNWAPFGSNLEGVGSACYFYFDKSCKLLTNEEIHFLVNIPQNPQKYTQLSNEKKMKTTFKAPHFTDYLIQKGLQQKEIKTTLDYKLQKSIEELAKKYFQSIGSFGIRNYSLVVVDNHKNEILAYIGSANYFDKDIKGQIDANRSLKPPGSILKPFIYALALQQGLIHEKTLLKDTRMSFSGINPENFDEQFLGPIASDQALILSRNLPAADLSRRLENPSLYQFMNGKSSMKFKDEKYYGLSLPLGSVEFTMLDLMKLYSSLGLRGKYRNLKVTLDEQRSMDSQILTAESTYIVLQMLKKNPRTESSTLQDLTISSVPIAWKTGTSKSFKDAWTFGLIGNYVVGIWFGDNDREMNPALVGRNVAAPLFFQIYDLIRNKPQYFRNQLSPIWDSRLGLNVKTVEICSLSKKIKTENCQHKSEDSFFIPSVSPIEKCQIHRKVYIDDISHKMSCRSNAFQKTTTKIIEVWPDDLLEVYRQAGLKKMTLSEKSFSCEQSMEQLKPLVITSPQENIEYLIQTTKNEVKKSKIQLRAISESDSMYLDWFVNKNYVGRSFKNNPLFFETNRPGRYVVSVVDNLGRSQNSTFNVKVISQ